MFQLICIILFKGRAEAHNRTLNAKVIAAGQAVVLPEGRSGNTQTHAIKRRVIAKRTDSTDQEGDSEQHDLLGAEKFVAGRTSQPGSPRRPQAEIEPTWTPRIMESILLALTARLDAANWAR